MAALDPTDFSARPVRVDIRRPAKLVDGDGNEIDVVILDISRSGFRVETEEPVKIGETVQLCVERDEQFSAKIRWALGKEAGGQFI